MVRSQAEAERLNALESYGIVDTDFEEIYDRLTRLAAEMFSTSISALSLIDHERQWFKSKQGLAARATARDIAFCSHAIQQRGCFVVADALLDSRFANNPLVVAAPFIRFYAGFPLCSPEGHALGTICVIDSKPRAEFSTDERARLEDFAGVIMYLLNARRESRRLSLELNLLRRSLDQIVAKLPR